MKKLFLILAASAAMLAAQDAQPAPAPVKAPDQVTRIIEVKRNTVDNIIGTVRQLYGITITGDASRRLIIARGPANIVEALAETIARLDVPAADTLPSPNVEITVQLIYGSAKGEANAKVPADLDGTIRQMKSLFPYASYRVMDTLLLRGRDTQKIEDSGTLPGTYQTGATIYQLSFTPNVAPGPAPHTVRLRSLQLGLRIPTISGPATIEGKPNTQFQYLSTGIITDLDAREGQKTVVGKSNVTGTDDAIILVVSPKVIE